MFPEVRILKKLAQKGHGPKTERATSEPSARNYLFPIVP
jgi:hypothetical protein